MAGETRAVKRRVDAVGMASLRQWKSLSLDAGVYDAKPPVLPIKRSTPSLPALPIQPSAPPVAALLPALRRRRLRSGACRHSGQWLNVGHSQENRMLALIQTIDLALGIYWWILIGAAVFSWLYAFNVVNPRNQFVGTVGNFLFRATEPVLAPIRRLLPDLGGIDISPIIVLLIIFFLRQFLWTTVAPLLL
jgi:Predicted integral membrane protein